MPPISRYARFVEEFDTIHEITIALTIPNLYEFSIVLRSGLDVGHCSLLTFRNLGTKPLLSVFCSMSWGTVLLEHNSSLLNIVKQL